MFGSNPRFIQTTGHRNDIVLTFFKSVPPLAAETYFRFRCYRTSRLKIILDGH